MTAFIRPAEPATLLTAQRRQRELDRLASGTRVDVLVVGGGVTGTGVALDAASRGLSVALIEAHDLAFGTSRWSSKLVHGGLRYLASGQVGVAWESAVERARIMSRIAPHLAHPMAQLIPIMDDTTLLERRLAASGFRAGDVLRRATGLGNHLLPAPRRLSAAEAARLVPALAGPRLRGGLLGWDGQLEDDARLVVALARTAAAYGAMILPRCRAERIHPDGAAVTDQLSGDTVEIRARDVINATGVWAGDLDHRVHLQPSLGSHVVLRAETLGSPTAALTVGVPGHVGRFVFALPQPNGLVYVGLTDEVLEGPIPDRPTAPEADIEWILGILSRPLGRRLTSADAVGSYAGVRPLVAASGASSDISRRHIVIGKPGEVITVTGGKLTTYRRMAQDAVDRISSAPCRTASLPLVGAGHTAAISGLPSRLVRRFGTEATAVAALAHRRPELLTPLASVDGRAVDVVGVELLWGIQAEGALRLEDLLERRTRVSLVPEDLAAVKPAAQAVVGAAFT